MLEALARSHGSGADPGVHCHPGGGALQEQPQGDTQLLLITSGRAVSGLGRGSGSGAGPQDSGKEPRRPGFEEREPHTYLFLALGRAGCLGCGPAWHSPAPPRASRASAQRQNARGRGRVRGHIPCAAGAPPAGS